MPARIDALTPDPLFETGQSPSKPKIANPGNQVSDATVAITPVPITVTGGTAPLTWTKPPTGRLDGLILDTSANPATITGAPRRPRRRLRSRSC